MKLIRRFFNVIVGIVFIAVSLCLQSIFFVLLMVTVVAGLGAAGLKIESVTLQWLIFALLLLSFNAIACWEYFKKHRAQTGLGRTSSAIFMVPRALDLIWNGSERVGR